MSAKIREYLETFVFVSVHEDGPYEPAKGRIQVDELVRRCIDLAQDSGITKEQMEAEVGDLYDFLRDTIDNKNIAEQARLGREDAADRKE